MLENAVHPIERLASIKQHAAQVQAAGSPSLTFNAYKKLVISAAQSYDKARKPPGLGSTRRQQIMAHDYVDYEESTPEPRTVQVHDIYTNLGTLLQLDPDPEHLAFMESNVPDDIILARIRMV